MEANFIAALVAIAFGYAVAVWAVRLVYYGGVRLRDMERGELAQQIKSLRVELRNVRDAVLTLSLSARQRPRRRAGKSYGKDDDFYAPHEHSASFTAWRVTKEPEKEVENGTRD